MSPWAVGFFGVWVPSLQNDIFPIFLRRSRPNMPWVNAHRIIACVARELSSRKRLPVVKLPSHLGGATAPPKFSDHAVAAFGARPNPGPTCAIVCRFCYAPPKSLKEVPVSWMRQKLFRLMQFGLKIRFHFPSPPRLNAAMREMASSRRISGGGRPA